MRLVSAAFVVALVLSTTAAFAQALPLGSVWTNDRTSTLKITRVLPSGQFEGEYVNNDKNFPCLAGEAVDAAGFEQNGLVTFWVNWRTGTKSCNSFTSWTGFVSGSTMNTNFSVVWKTTAGHDHIEGTDDFTKQ